ncbi:MAG: hypothetical protein SPJ04_05640, partial [Bdellovibrionota bacterium]|nr:hypothetical protein [Bdellovibrionota bacterium]
MKTDISNKNTCFDLNRTSITSPLSQISISITEKIQNVILKTSNQLKAGNIKEAENILQAHDFIKKLVINPNKVTTASKDRLVKCLRNGWTIDAEEIVSFMKEQGIIEEKITELFNSEVHYKERVVTACKDGLVKYLSNGWDEQIERIVSFMKEQGIIKEKITELFNSEVNYKEKVVTACTDGLVICLSNGLTNDAKSIVSFMEAQGIIKEKIPEVFNSKEMKQIVTACKDGVVKCLSDSWIGAAKRIVSFMKEQGIIKEKIVEVLKTKEIRDIVTACKDTLVEYLSYGRTGYAKEIVFFMKEQGINEKEIIKKLEIIKVLLNCKSIEDLFEHDCKFLLYVIKNNINEFSFPDKIISNNLIKKCGLYAIYKEFNERGNFDFYIDKKQLYKILKKHDERWQDEINISKPFDEGAEEFGIDNMFIYLSGRNVNLHDALYNFNKICKLFKKSKIDNNAFFNNILRQVRDDNGTYNEGSAYDHLNSIAYTLCYIDVENIFQEAEKLKDTLPEIDKLLKVYENNVCNVFSSWNNLKNFMKLYDVASEKDYAEYLKRIRSTNKALYNYVKPLIFHKDSRVALEDVMLFCKAPEEFLEKSYKKGFGPQEYLKYGLTAEEFRDAFVSGKLDDIARFRPCEKRFEIELPLQDAIIKALGKQEKGIKPECEKAGVLFKELNKILEDSGVTIKAIVNGEAKVPEGYEQAIKEELNKKEYKIKIPKIKFIATIHKKSDPFAALVGNDTNCCMPFGSAKMMEYMFNPNCAIFSIRIQKPDGKYRTIAQSVLTPDIDIEKSINSDYKRLSELSAEVFKKPLVLTCDNIEVAANYKNQIKNIENFYKIFFKEYLKEYGESLNLDKDRVIIGKGYSDALTSLQTVKNTFIPTAGIEYSDNDQKAHSTCYILNFDDTNNSNNASYISSDLYKSQEIIIDKKNDRGISELSPSDVLLISYLEDMIYDKTKLAKGFIKLQQQIIAKLYLNKIRKRPNFMFKVSDKENGCLGYMIAFESGRKEEDGTIKNEVYVSDYAVRQMKWAKRGRYGLKLIEEFIERYLKAYKDSKNFPQIVGKFREGTSYEIIKDLNKFNKYLSKYGLKA